MSHTIPCRNPALHHVEFHQAGSIAAIECMNPSTIISNRTHKVPTVTSSASPVGKYGQHHSSITSHESSIKKIGEHQYQITSQFQLSAETEDDAYEEAESIHPNFEDSGISAIQIEDNQWDVTTQFTVNANNGQEAQLIANNEFVKPPNWKPLLESI